tara:strand:- start:2441 stop:3340 length:900 start_codon:yes stop_codon:yes gene_type:complete
MTYRQSGIIYRQPNFAYNKSDAIVAVSTVALEAKTVLTYSYKYAANAVTVTYNQPGLTYVPANDVGISISVTAHAATVNATSAVYGNGSIPATVTAPLIAVTSQVAAATGPLAIDLNMNYIALPGHIITVTAAPSATPMHIQSPATIGVTTDKIDDSNLFIATVVYSPLIVVPSDIKASTTPMSVVLTPQTINVKADVQVIPIYRQVVQWTENIVQRTSPEGTITANSLQRYMGPLPRARNIFIINNATVSDTQPYDHSTVTRTILGAHATPLDLTEAEETLLVAAGYPFNVGPADASL